jgi:hypothetical protein
MPIMSRQYKRAEPLIRTILFYDWDPIGVSDSTEEEIQFAKLQHEYDRYVHAIYSLIIRDDRSGLLTLLSSILTEEMGLEQNDLDSNKKIVDLLFNLNIK